VAARAALAAAGRRALRPARRRGARRRLARRGRDAAFFDADGDRDLDLYVVTAGNEFWGDAPALLDRLYLNDGRGRFRRADDGALPPLTENGSCVAPATTTATATSTCSSARAVVSRQYGVAPRSALLENDGTGRFTDVTARVAPMLERLGMVTAAVWTDRDGDGRPSSSSSASGCR
jgi:hypothetical protein